MKFFSIIILAFLFSKFLSAQQWHNPNHDFQQREKDFLEYWKGKEITKGCGYKPYARELNFWLPRSGVNQKYAGQILWNEVQKLNNQINKTQSSHGNWNILGPIGEPVAGDGIGRVTCIAFHPNNSQIIYVGTPAGGLWKSTNGGISYVPMTDHLPVIGVSEIVLDPNNPDIIYIATGDRSANDTYTIGVLKSLDGGLTWNTTGLSALVSSQMVIRRMIMHPDNSNILFTAGSNGIYKTTDGGSTWFLKASGNFYDLEFKPDDPSIIYASGNGFIRKSIDTGETWQDFQNGINLTNAGRIEIAVTPSEPEWIYGLVANRQTNGLHSVIKSEDGNNWVQLRDASVNYLGWSNDGSTPGGQGWFDLAIAVNPSNKNEIFLGGVNIWRSTNGGTSFSIAGHWQGFGAPYIHADIHYFVYQGSTLYVGCDGGIYKRNGSNWQSLNGNLAIHQIYKIGGTEADPELVNYGSQDNGTTKYDNGISIKIRGADGMETCIDPVSPNVMYSSIYYGAIYRSMNRGGTFSNISVGSEEGAWVTPYMLNPQNRFGLFIGLKNVWKSTDRGNSWTKISDFNLGNITALVVAPSDSNIIYVGFSGSIYKTTNGGMNWELTNFQSSNNLTYIKIHPTNPNHLYVTVSGYTPNEKIYVTKDGGNTWENISIGLPNVPANCVEYQMGSDDGIYVGTDIGVFYKNNQIPVFQPFSNGLPRVIVNELEINYASQKIRAGTYGRGLWESDLFTNPTQIPTVYFNANPLRTCLYTSVNFQDSSTNIPIAWKWEFPNGIPSVSNLPNPTVQYSNAGLYDVKLTVSNVVGSDSLLKSQYINILPANSMPYSEGFENQFLPDSLWKINSDDTIQWNLTQVINKSGQLSNVIKMPCYGYSNLGAIDEIISSPIDVKGYQNAKLYFDLSYARYNSSQNERLRVQISTDCGNTFSQVYNRSNTNLQTTSETTNEFVPNDANQWRTDSINLNNYLSSGTIIIKFLVTNGNGNHLYLDNINIRGECQEIDFNLTQSNDTIFTDIITNKYEWYRNDTLLAITHQPFFVVSQNGDYQLVVNINGCEGSKSVNVQGVSNAIAWDNVAIKIYPNPTEGILWFVSNQLIFEPIKIECWDLQGKIQKSLENHQSWNNIFMDISDLNSGMYLIKIETIDKVFWHKIIKE